MVKRFKVRGFYSLKILDRLGPKVAKFLDR